MLEPELNTVHISRFEAREPIKIFLGTTIAQFEI
jgi:hypothetical protein